MLLSVAAVVSAYSSQSIIELCESGYIVNRFTLYRNNNDPTAITDFYLPSANDE